jgi:hypothetical protein
MSVPLYFNYPALMNYERAKEIINHGNADCSMTDPSQSEILRSKGVPRVTTIIEQLSAFDLIADAKPGKGCDGKALIFLQPYPFSHQESRIC